MTGTKLKAAAAAAMVVLAASPAPLAAQAAQARPAIPAVPSPPLNDDRISLCWAAMTETFYLMRARGAERTMGRDDPENKVREAMGYYGGQMSVRFEDDARVQAAMQSGMRRFRASNRAETTVECVRDYGLRLQHTAPFVLALFQD